MWKFFPTGFYTFGIYSLEYVHYTIKDYFNAFTTCCKHKCSQTSLSVGPQLLELKHDLPIRHDYQNHLGLDVDVTSPAEAEAAQHLDRIVFNHMLYQIHDIKMLAAIKINPNILKTSLSVGRQLLELEDDIPVGHVGHNRLGLDVAVASPAEAEAAQHLDRQQLKLQLGEPLAWRLLGMIILDIAVILA